MTNKREGAERFSLARWSQRKLDSAKTAAVPTDAPANVSARAPSEVPAPPGPSLAQVPATAGTQAAAAPLELPPVDALTFDSDFTAFLRPGVDPDLRRAALKQLFRDPRFNVMDGLDVYIDDYSKADPIPPDMLAELMKRFDFTAPWPEPAIADQSAAPSDAAAAPAALATAYPRQSDGASAASSVDSERAAESSRELANTEAAQSAPAAAAQEPAAPAAEPLSRPGETTGR